MDVAGQLQQVGVGVNQNSFVAPLKEMARPALAPVPPACISKGEILNDPGKPNVPNLNCQVHMGCHQTESMDSVSIALDALLQHYIEPETIFLVEKDLLPSVSPQHDVV